MAFIKNTNDRGKSFVIFLFFLAIIIGAGYLVYTNQDFQRSHRKEISKINFYLRDYKKQYKKFRKTLDEKIAAWKKSHPKETKKTPPPPKIETRTFDDLIYPPEDLQKELPPEMIRHQPDEFTFCSFNADFLLNNKLSDKETVHLANILRFCDLTSITGLSNLEFLDQITTLLKILRYDAVFESSAAVNPKEKAFIYLYRNDKVKSLNAGKLFTAENSFSSPPYCKSFKIDTFDFTIASFYSPLENLRLTPVLPLKNLYETLSHENPGIKDIMIFGNFLFNSQELRWDSSSLLPTFAQAANLNKNESELIGNFWFKKNDLVEYNGKSGILNIDENQFPSKQKSYLAGDKPIWAQFKIMPDDD